MKTRILLNQTICRMNQKNVHENQAIPSVPQAPVASVAPSPGQGSYPLQVLMRKMDLFKRLLAEDKNTGAALVANDIHETLANFDPQIYFPEIFSGFVRQYALNVEKILPYQNCGQSAVWQAAQQLYQVDMESFAQMDNGFHFREPGEFMAADSYSDGSESQSYSDSYGDDDTMYEEGGDESYYDDEMDD